MNGAVKDAAEQLLIALRTVAGVHVYTDPGANPEPPAVVLGPPSLRWESGCPGPTSATFLVYVLVDSNEFAVDRLWQLVADVADAIDAHTDAVVLRADPTTRPAGTTELPAYEIQTEVGLQ